MKFKRSHLAHIVLFLAKLLVACSYHIECNFETPCVDMILDKNWGLTDGLHPRPLSQDHTLNLSSGHYVFYIPHDMPGNVVAEIKTRAWINPIINQGLCFQFWYYTPHENLPFTVQFLQGDDELLARVALSISGKDPMIEGWTSVNIILPAEKIKVYIRLNVSVGTLLFDDFIIDYCNQTETWTSQILLACDFESSCINNFVSLPEYFQQWSIVQASAAVEQQSEAPAIDFTFANRSGHYIWLKHSTVIQQGSVAYLLLQSPLNITISETYCLNFEYYGYGSNSGINLKVYLMTNESHPTVKMLWPRISSNHYQYTRNKWSWVVVNLPVGYYSLMFRIDASTAVFGSYALDNIAIASCRYPPSTTELDDSLLSFACDFDSLTMCGMINGNKFISIPTFNFTVLTGETVPFMSLGPTHDHTNNASSGGFLYWMQELPFIFQDNGAVSLQKRIEQNSEMCIQFAYYIKSMAMDRNGTTLIVVADGCDIPYKWILSTDDSDGWQVGHVSVGPFACSTRFSFIVTQNYPIPVSVALDDVQITQCNLLNSATTTTVTTTTISTVFTTNSATTHTAAMLIYNMNPITWFLKILISASIFLIMKQMIK